MQEIDIWLYFAQIVQGLRQCHFPETREQENPDGRVVLHRDLKEANRES
jgi:serine/threonine protein kinase